MLNQRIQPYLLVASFVWFSMVKTQIYSILSKQKGEKWRNYRHLYNSYAHTVPLNNSKGIFTYLWWVLPSNESSHYIIHMYIYMCIYAFKLKSTTSYELLQKEMNSPHIAYIFVVEWMKFLQDMFLARFFGFWYVRLN